MKCHDCGAEVENLGYLKKHKAECPGKLSVVDQFSGLTAVSAGSVTAFKALDALAKDAEPTPTVAAFRVADAVFTGLQEILRVTPGAPAPEWKAGFIPYSLCAEELPTLGVGTTVVLQVVGRLTEGGVVVEEAELL